MSIQQINVYLVLTMCQEQFSILGYNKEENTHSPCYSQMLK